MAARIPTVMVGAVLDEHGRHWLYAGDLAGGGWPYPVETFQRFELIDGQIVEVIGRDEPRRRYWVEPLGPSDGGF